MKVLRKPLFIHLAEVKVRTNGRRDIRNFCGETKRDAMKKEKLYGVPLYACFDFQWADSEIYFSVQSILFDSHYDHRYISFGIGVSDEGKLQLD